MSKMGEIDAEMEILRADVKELRERVKLERELTDYWYERAVKAEADLVRYAGILGD